MRKILIDRKNLKIEIFFDREEELRKTIRLLFPPREIPVGTTSKIEKAIEYVRKRNEFTISDVLKKFNITCGGIVYKKLKEAAIKFGFKTKKVGRRVVYYKGGRK